MTKSDRLIALQKTVDNSSKKLHLVDVLAGGFAPKFVAYDPKSGSAFSISKVKNGLGAKLDDDIRFKLATGAKESFNWDGVPESGLATFGQETAIVIKGDLKADASGPAVHLEQYVFANSKSLYTFNWMCLTSDKASLAPTQRAMLESFKHEL